MRRALVLALVLACGAAPRAPPPTKTDAPQSIRDLVAALGESALDSPELAAAMARLARGALVHAPDVEDEKALLERVLLYVAAQDPAAANATLARLRKTAKPYDPRRASVLDTHYELHSDAKLLQARTGGGFDEAFRASFRAKFAALDDLAADLATWTPDTDLGPLRAGVEAARERARAKPAAETATELATLYATYAIRRDILPLAAALQHEDVARRYVVEDVSIKTHDGATVTATVVRPRGLATRAPAILFSSIYVEGLVRRAVAPAARGFVGVAATPRGKRTSRDEIVPYEHDT